MIRPALVDDAGSIADIHIRSFLESYAHLPKTHRAAREGLGERVRTWERRLRDPEKTTLIAVQGEGVVGFIHIGRSPDSDAGEWTGHIFSVHVDPVLTGSGIGSRLVSTATAELTHEGFRTATLWAVSDNERACRFYDRLGWRRDGAVRSEKLSVGTEDGDEVEVSRFGCELSVTAGGR